MRAAESGTVARQRALVWWILWGSMLLGEVLVYAVLARGPVPAPGLVRDTISHLIGMIPVFLAIVTRWLLWPRTRTTQAGFMMFVVGVALGEMAAFLGVFLGGPYRDVLFVLGVLATAQFVPLDVRRFYRTDGSPITG